MDDRQPDRIRAARTYSRLSRKQIADHLEVSERTVTETELGNRSASRPELLAIAEATGAPMWFLERGWDGWQKESAESIDEVGRRALKDIEGGRRPKRAAGD